MNTIILHGALAEEFGAQHRYLVDTPAEAIRALIANKRGFKAALEKMEVRLIRSKESTEAGLDLDCDMLSMGMSESTLHIVPAVSGAKEGGLGKAILGVVLVAAVIISAGGASPFAAGAFGAGGAYAGLAGNLLLGGFAMALGGISMMLSPVPKPDDTEQKGSFLFNGAVNVSAQGGPVPLVYGLMLTGSVVGSLSVTDEQVNVSSTATGPFVGGTLFGFEELFKGLSGSGSITSSDSQYGGNWLIEDVGNTLVSTTQLTLND